MQVTRLVRRFGIIALLILIVSNAAVWSNEENTAQNTSFASHTRVITFVPNAGHWVLTTFGKAEPGNEFYFIDQLYRVIEAGKAQFILNVDTGKLFEADPQYDESARRPIASDIVQVRGKDMRFVAHSMLSTVQPDAIIRFQGRAYSVKADRSLASTGTVFSSKTSILQRIEITNSALQHIIDRHTLGGNMNAGKSIFNANENIQALIKNAQLLAPIWQASGNSKSVFDAGRMIGTDRSTGKQTSTYTVITTHSGKLVTAFPGMP